MATHWKRDRRQSFNARRAERRARRAIKESWLNAD
jgi:hypothetical protein